MCYGKSIQDDAGAARCLNLPKLSLPLCYFLPGVYVMAAGWWQREDQSKTLLCIQCSLHQEKSGLEGGGESEEHYGQILGLRAEAYWRKSF